MSKSDTRDISNLRLQQLRERLELYSATINGTVSMESTKKEDANLNQVPQSSKAALSDPSNLTHTHASLPKAAQFISSHKRPSTIGLASQTKNLNKGNSESTLNALKNMTKLFTEKNRSISMNEALETKTKTPVQSYVSVKNDHANSAGVSKTESSQSPYSIGSTKSTIAELNSFSIFTKTVGNKILTTEKPLSMHVRESGSTVHREATASARGGSTTPQVSFSSENRGEGSLCSDGAEKDPGQYCDESTQDTSTEQHGSESSFSDEEALNFFLDKIFNTAPLMGKDVEETFSNTYALLKRTPSKGGEAHATDRVACTKASERHASLSSQTPAAAKYRNTQHLRASDPILACNHQHHSDTQRDVSTIVQQNASIICEKTESDLLTSSCNPQSIVNPPRGHARTSSLVIDTTNDEAEAERRSFVALKCELKDQGCGDTSLTNTDIQSIEKNSFADIEVAFQHLEAVVQAMRKVYRSTGIALFPSALPKIEEGTSLAARRQRLIHEEAELRANQPKTLSLEEIRASSGMEVEKIARQLIQECEVAMDCLKDVEERRCKLQDKRDRLGVRQNDFKERKKSRALINDEIDILRRQNSERASALRDREKRYLEKLAEHSSQEEQIQKQINEVEQLSHNITTWLRILEERDTSLSAKEEKLRRVQADLQRRIDDVQTYKELKNQFESQVPRQGITSE